MAKPLNSDLAQRARLCILKLKSVAHSWEGEIEKGDFFTRGVFPTPQTRRLPWPPDHWKPTTRLVSRP